MLKIINDTDAPDLTTGKKEYQVLLNYTEYGKVYIKANNPEEAEKKVEKYLSYYGLEGLDKFNYDCQDRDYNAQDAEEV